MKRILFFIVLGLFAAFSLENLIFAEVEDHPVIKPAPGSTASHKPRFKESDTYTLKYTLNDKMVEMKVEGSHWSYNYQYLKENGQIDRSITGPETVKYFKEVVIKQKGEILKETNSELIYTVRMSDGEKAWARVFCNGWKGYYQLDIVEEESEEKPDIGKNVTQEQSKQNLSQTTAMKRSSESISASFPSMLNEAEEFQKAGKNFEAIKKLKQAVLQIWNDVPLTVQNVRIVEDTKTYLTRQNSTFGSGEKIYITAEIFGYTFKRIGDAYSINISTDVYFLQGGEVMAGQQNFGAFELITPIPSTEFRLDLTYWLTDAPAGVYDVQTVVHDMNSGQSTKFTTQIKMK